MAASRPQLAIAMLSSTAFIARFFLIYPGGFLFYYDRPVEALPKVTFEGLQDRYRAGEGLAFSVRVEGYWNDDGSFPETVVKKVTDMNGEATDEMTWLDRGTKGSPLKL